MSLHHHHLWSLIIFSSIAFSALDRAPSYSFCSETCESLTASLCQSGPRGTSNSGGEEDDSIRPEVESRYLWCWGAGLGSWGLFVANETVRAEHKELWAQSPQNERPFQQFDEKYMFKYNWVTVTGWGGNVVQERRPPVGLWCFLEVIIVI